MALSDEELDQISGLKGLPGYKKRAILLHAFDVSTKNVEYNQLDVFINAKKYSATKQTVTSQHKKQPTNKTGYQLFIREVRPIVQRRNPDVPFGTITKMVAQMWNELTPAEQEDYTQKAKNLPDGNDENQEVGGGGDMYFGMPPPQPPQDDGTGGMYNLGLGGQFQN